MTQTVMGAGIALTDKAAAKVAELLADEDDDLFLRVGVQPGGCAGLRYQLFFDNQYFDGDVETVCAGVRIVVDSMSISYLDGATIDFSNTISKQGFTIDNPNAVGTCSCGDSFC